MFHFPFHFSFAPLPWGVLIIIAFVILVMKRPAVAMVLVGILAMAGFLGVLYSHANARRAVAFSNTKTVMSTVVPTTTTAGPTSKPWVDRWTDFVSASQSPGWGMLRAESGETCVTQEEARTQSIESAEQQLEPLVNKQLGSIRSILRGTLNNPIREQLLASLNSGEFIADQMVKRIDKPYGTLWKQYLLIDARPQTLASIADHTRQLIAQQNSENATTFGSLAALVGVIVLVYAFLNSATKGYFVWRLRTAAILVLIVAVLAALAMI